MSLLCPQETNPRALIHRFQCNVSVLDLSRIISHEHFLQLNSWEFLLMTLPHLTDSLCVCYDNRKKIDCHVLEVNVH